MLTHQPAQTYFNPTDGNTYYLAPLGPAQHPVLWACPTSADGTPDFGSAISEADFAEALPPIVRRRIVAAIGS